MLEQLEEKVLERISFLNQAEEEDVYRLIDEVLAEEAKREFLSLKQRREYRKRLFYGLKGLDILQELVEDDSITEIMVNGIGHIFLEREECFGGNQRKIRL